MVKQLNPISMTEPGVEEWMVEVESGADEEDALAEIPASAPFGSRALVLIKDDELTENNMPKGKLTLKIKDSAGDWVEVFRRSN